MKKSILAGDYLLAEAGEEVAKLKSIPILEITSHTLKQLVKGEWLQAEIKNKETEESVQKVHTLKTASLFQWSVCAPFLLKGFKTKPLYKGLNKIGRVMGLLFQRADDLLDFDIRNKEGKTAFKDLEEGFFNSFALHLLKHKVVDQKSLLQKCRSLKDLKQLTAKNTPALFNKTLKDFDAISQQMITQSEGEMQHLLEQQVEETCIKKALKDLKKWPKKLYWRT